MEVIITPQLKEKIRTRAQEYDLNLALLFGSQTTGTARTDSDVDVAVQAIRLLSEEELARLSYDLGPVFGKSQVDVVSLSHAGPLLKRRILDEGIVLYERTGHEFSTFEVSALREYAEAQPLFEIRREKIAAFTRS